MEFIFIVSFETLKMNSPLDSVINKLRGRLPIWSRNELEGQLSGELRFQIQDGFAPLWGQLGNQLLDQLQGQIWEQLQ